MRECAVKRCRRSFVGCVVVAAAAVCWGAELAQAAQQAVTIETDGTTFRVVSSHVYAQDPPRVYRQLLRDRFLYLEAVDASGEIVEVFSRPDPREVVYDYVELTDQQSIPTASPQPLRGGRVIRPSATFVVRVPLESHIVSLRIFRQRASATAPIGGSQEESFISPRSSGPLPQGIELVPQATLQLDGGAPARR